MFSNSTNGTSVVSESNMKLGQVLEIIFLVLLMFFIIFGNILVCLAFNTFRHQLKTITNYFLVNLACSDFLVGVFPLPFWISVRTGYLRQFSTPYHVYIALDILSGCSSILNLTIISLERVYAVNSPITQHRNISRNKSFIFGAVIFVWCYSILLVGLYPLTITHGFKDYTLLIVILAFILPTLVIIASYVTIIYMIKSRGMQTQRLQQEIKVTGMMAIVILLFLLCWFPFFLLNMLFHYCPCGVSISHSVIQYVKYLHYSNSAMNPVIYAYRNKYYQSAFKRILCRAFSCSKGT